MKILNVISHYWPAFQYGGPVAAVHSLNKALVKKGVEVTVYSTAAGLSNKVIPGKEADIEGVKVTYFAFSKFLEFLGSFGWQFSPQMSRAMKNNLSRFNLVYIVNAWSYPASIAAHYSRHFGKPYIVVPSGMFYPETISAKSWKKMPYFHFLVKRLLKDSTVIHYTTQVEAERTHSFLGLNGRYIIVPNGIDFSEFTNLPDRSGFRLKYPQIGNKKVILFLGRINRIKGLDILTDAFAKLIMENSEMHLVVAGCDENGYAKKIMLKIKKNGLNENQVTFTGMLTGEEKLEAIAGSDIFVLPSYSENFGMAAIEAMACGLPVVISNKVGIYKEVEQNKAGVVTDTNADSLYKGIKLLLENSALSNEIASNARKLVERCYDIDKVADKMIEVFQSIVK